MKVVIYTRPDGGACVCYPAPSAQRVGESEDEFIARVRQGSVPADATNVQIVEASAIPTDRAFRNAWRVNGSGVSCDMTAAKDLARDMLRVERRERFTLLDGQWMRATARGEALVAAAIEAKRETLRNWPADQRVVACASAAELKALIQTMKGEVA